MLYIGSPGARIAYAVHRGRADGPPLVLLHGFTASSASFLANIGPLSRRFTVISPELLGHGRSDAPDQPEPYGVGPTVGRLLQLLDELGVERVLLCGHSLGGALALRFALDHPERVAGLIVISSNSAAGPDGWRDQVRPSLATMAERARNEGPAFLKGTRLYPARSRRLPEDARDALAADFELLTGAGVAGTA